jgi:nucleotide-binding universal stress UspA family protein
MNPYRSALDCPMLTTSAHGYYQEGMMFKRILCATDGSEHGDRALREAVRIALGSDGELHVAHVIEKMPGGGRLRGQNVHLTEFEIDSRIVRQTEELTHEEGITTAQVHIVPGGGHPAKQLAELADRIDADLIVLGTRGHSPLAGIVLGSVTQQLVHATSRPVLAVPPEHVTRKRAAPARAVAGGA